VNLECPLIREETPTEKIGPVLGAPQSCVKGLKAMGIDLVGLANNHIMDHGARGLQTTIEVLQENGIGYVGAGGNLEEARRSFLLAVKGIQIGILAVAENEFGIATNETAGANPLNVIDFVRNVSQCRAQFDHLIVLVHGGNELYPYPSPRLMETCRFFVEQGATAVVCQHSHCVGCMETYQGAPIIYGQGNLLFDLPSSQKDWYKGAIIELEIAKYKECGVRLIPYRQSGERPGIRRMSPEEEGIFQDEFSVRSAGIQQEGFVEEQWRIFCAKRKRYYLNTLHGRCSLIRRIAGRLDVLHYLDSKDVHRVRLNLIRCESHREALETILEYETM